MARRFPLPILLAAPVLACIAIGGVVVAKRHAARPPVAPLDLPVAPAPPPPPRQPTVAEVAGGAGGDGTVLAVAGPDERLISDDGLATLRAYEKATGTGALLVWYHGALQVEDYAGGVRPADRLDGLGLERGVLTLLTGTLARGEGDARERVRALLDQPLAQLLPDWSDDPRGEITVGDLLRGTSGLGTPPGDPHTDARRWDAAAPLEVRPGSRWRPLPVEMQVLAQALEHRTGQSLPSLLSSALWQPLGARPADALLDATGAAGIATCCLKATARDWLRLGLLIKDHGTVGGVEVVPGAWIDAMESPFPLARNQGLGLLLAWPHEKGGPVRAGAPWVEQDTLFLAGADGQRLYVSRVADLVILRLAAPASGSEGQPEQEGAVDDARLPNLVAAHLSKLAQPPVPGRGWALPPITPPRHTPSVEQRPLAPLAHPPKPLP